MCIYNFSHVQMCLWDKFLTVELLCQRVCAFLFKVLFIFREMGREGGRGRETSMCEGYIHQLPPASLQLGTWPTTQACALTGDRTGDLSVLRLALHPLSHTGEGGLVLLKCW